MRKLLTALLCCFCISPASAGSNPLEQEEFRFGRSLYCKGESVRVLAATMTIDMDKGSAIEMIQSGGAITCSWFNASEMDFVQEWNSTYDKKFTVFINQFSHDNEHWYRWRYEYIKK